GPRGAAQAVRTPENTATAITLTATDVDGDPLTYLVGTDPAHGTLSGTAPTLTYTPAANYNGTDRFTFTANDGTVDSAPATVSLTITAPSITLDAAEGTAGGTVTATIANGPGRPGDWAGLYDANGTPVQWQYLNGTHTLPAGRLEVARG